MENTIIPIIIQNAKNRSITIYVSLNETIASAKEKYYNKVGSKVYNQWKYDGDVLQDNQTFLEIGIEKNDIITEN